MVSLVADGENYDKDSVNDRVQGAPAVIGQRSKSGSKSKSSDAPKPAERKSATKPGVDNRRKPEFVPIDVKIDTPVEAVDPSTLNKSSEEYFMTSSAPGIVEKAIIMSPVKEEAKMLDSTSHTPASKFLVVPEHEPSTVEGCVAPEGPNKDDSESEEPQKYGEHHTDLRPELVVEVLSSLRLDDGDQTVEAGVASPLPPQHIKRRGTITLDQPSAILNTTHSPVVASEASADIEIASPLVSIKLLGNAIFQLWAPGGFFIS